MSDRITENPFKFENLNSRENNATNTIKTSKTEIMWGNILNTNNHKSYNFAQATIFGMMTQIPQCNIL